MSPLRRAAPFLVPVAVCFLALVPLLLRVSADGKHQEVQSDDAVRSVPYGGLADVPVVNLSLVDGNKKDQAALARSFQHAFETVGMLRLQHTGLPSEIVKALETEVGQFFSLPRERKETFGYGPDKYKVPLGGTYPQGRRYRVQSSFQDKSGETVIVNEWLQHRSVMPPDEWWNRSSDSYYSSPKGKLFYKEVRNGDYTFPEEVPELKAAVESYYREMEALSTKVLRAFALSLNVSEDFFLQRCRKGAEWPVTIAHYPDTADKEVPPGIMRINPHWDRDLFALVVMPPGQQFSEENALQVLTDSAGNGVDGRSQDLWWRAVPLQQGEVLVNLGELMARYSNGRFKHVVHQVPNRKHSGSRLTFMAYVRPNYDQIVEPITAPGEAALYSALPAGLVSTYDNEKASGLYDKCAREKLRLAQGMYSSHGQQGAVRFPSHTLAVEVPGCPKQI
mmetsp:Transcript_44553/g.83619  ORF Transcript_44553/g.83619 Transcript_44553/m.83619 type:complete len:449 (-) Transcript_44553:51-1397(-)